ncbi:TPA: hypothetical protein TY768_001437 [Streptococcus suis]|nr:hypothetical protein [Streptococcus suis]
MNSVKIGLSAALASVTMIGAGQLVQADTTYMAQTYSTLEQASVKSPIQGQTITVPIEFAC